MERFRASPCLGPTAHLALQFRHTFDKLGLRCFWKLRVDALA